MRRVGCGEKRLIHRTPSDENTRWEKLADRPWMSRLKASSFSRAAAWAPVLARANRTRARKRMGVGPDKRLAKSGGRQLNGRLDLDWRSIGLCCTMAYPEDCFTVGGVVGAPAEPAPEAAKRPRIGLTPPR